MEQPLNIGKSEESAALFRLDEFNPLFACWLEYFVEGLATQMREVQERGEHIIRLDVLSHKHDFSKRQTLAIKHALAHGGLTIQDFEIYCSGISRRTLQRELKDLVEKGLLAPEGATNRLYYRLVK